MMQLTFESSAADFVGGTCFMEAEGDAAGFGGDTNW
jgi:hypothetical protein